MGKSKQGESSLEPMPLQEVSASAQRSGLKEDPGMRPQQQSAQEIEDKRKVPSWVPWSIFLSAVTMAVQMYVVFGYQRDEVQGDWLQYKSVNFFNVTEEKCFFNSCQNETRLDSSTDKGEFIFRNDTSLNTTGCTDLTKGINLNAQQISIVSASTDQETAFYLGLAAYAISFLVKVVLSFNLCCRGEQYERTRFGGVKRRPKENEQAQDASTMNALTFFENALRTLATLGAYWAFTPVTSLDPKCGTVLLNDKVLKYTMVSAGLVIMATFVGYFYSTSAVRAAKNARRVKAKGKASGICGCCINCYRRSVIKSSEKNAKQGLRLAKCVMTLAMIALLVMNILILSIVGVDVTLNLPSSVDWPSMPRVDKIKFTNLGVAVLDTLSYAVALLTCCCR